MSLECLEELRVIVALSDSDLCIKLQYMLPSAGPKGMHFLAPFFALYPSVISAVTAHPCVWICSGGVHHSAATFGHWLAMCSADGGIHLCDAATAVCVFTFCPRASVAIAFFVRLRVTTWHTHTHTHTHSH